MGSSPLEKIIFKSLNICGRIKDHSDLPARKTQCLLTGRGPKQKGPDGGTVGSGKV
jgi:hypothetical protein